MILYRQAINEDFDFTFILKRSTSKKLVEKIWGWDEDVQLKYHKNQFNPNEIKIIIYGENEVGDISTFITENILLIENILIDPDSQGRNIGTRVLLDTIETASEYNRIIELQVLKN
ncbi:GNAT family N-acetyltransferase [Pedobacter cryotolerans]|uniref:GNAT family N-acetyltransferase n=1 Tax=Pedobacter cryotolerans TaxID=2571270 RepID=A0A4U1C2M6_9SPHI|nr:GNAT family N-acetyltransferase [Pedobacter cryotolerans]TKB99298.1 GNAT family N-acetyltransferase [Pedobacter cryotolerans]